jgi:hypothetical protein
MNELKSIEKVVEQVKRLEEAEHRVHPIQQVVSNGEREFIKQLEVKAPELVDVFKAIRLLSFGMMQYVKGEKAPASEWVNEIETVQKFVMNLEP